MFGLSRGAYMVRCIAGMINNCGIIKPVTNLDGTVNIEETQLLCQQVYRLYRSKDPINAPHSPQSLLFRQKASWPLIGDEKPGDSALNPPVKFMGLFDTVGSLGIPEFVGGVGLDYPRFHDQDVSSVVDLVYHAVSQHDRFYIFPPCLARRVSKSNKSGNYGITQKWFPGVHYDLGRQNFRFLRVFGGTWLERLLARLTYVSKEIHPNEVLSDLVLKWMLESIKANDPKEQIISTSKVDLLIVEANERMVSENRQIGDGDVYANVIAYAPFGKLILELFKMFWGTRWEVNQVYQLFFALRDRVVADLKSPVYDYKEVDLSISDAKGRTIQQLAGINDKRYPSRTFEAWTLCRRILGLQPGLPS